MVRLTVKRAAACEKVAAAVSALLLGALLLASPRVVAEQNQPAPAAAPCVLEPGPVAAVNRIVDGETLLLDDGQTVRLIGALAPGGLKPPDDPLSTDTARALAVLVAGKRIQLAFHGRRADRYGQLLAHVFVADGAGGQRWVQGELIAAGLARAYVLPESVGCGVELTAHEQAARDQRAGLWASDIFRRRDATQVAVLMRLRNSFQVVGGTVAVISKTKTATYLNFGSDWHTDFTARIAASTLQAHPDWARSLDAMTGREIEVHGWIERRNGPMIDIIDPAQVVIPAAAEPRLSSRGSTPGDRAPANAERGAENNEDLPQQKSRPQPEATGGFDL